MAESQVTVSWLVVQSSPAPSVKVLSFNRPSKRNALSQALIDEFIDKLNKASQDDLVKAIVVTGTRDIFSAGADIKEISAMGPEDVRRARYLADLCSAMKSVRKPMIAAVEGMAIYIGSPCLLTTELLGLAKIKLGGGFEIAMMCDVILASERTQFGLPEVTIGLLPGAGGTQRLTAACGKFRAMKMILSGAPIPAAEAVSMGLVSDVYEPGTVLKHAISFASRLASNSPQAIALAKEAILRADELGRDEDFERSLYYYAFGSHDKNEGVTAFLEKRKATWG